MPDTTRRTPEQIAKDEYDDATAQVLKSERRVNHLEAELQKAKDRLARHRTLRDYRGQHPLLQQPATTEVDQ